MKILVTGAKGFIGKNLVERLKYRDSAEILEFDRNTPADLLEEYCRSCDFIFHLAGINRPEREEEFREGNFGFTETLLEALKRHQNRCPIVFSSSVQAERNNPYGISKRDGERLLTEYGNRYQVKILIYRFPNIFGKWCRPNYNSVAATFCYNTARNLPLKINGRDTQLNMVYIDDVVSELIRALDERERIRAPKGVEDAGKEAFGKVEPIYKITLGEMASLLESFRESRTSLLMPEMPEGSFEKKLYSTYLSYLPEDGFKYPLKMHTDERGSFTEILRTAGNGQFSVNIIKPGVEKGNHWHNTKNEKFIVVSGSALIQFRRPDAKEILSYHVSAKQLEAVDIPVGYTHRIVNEGDGDLVTLMWCNELFDPNRADTYALGMDHANGGKGI